MVKHVAAVPPDGDPDLLGLNRPLDFAEARHDLVVDREQQVPRLQEIRGGRAGNQPGDRENLAPDRAGGLDTTTPFTVEPEAPGLGEGARRQLGLERVQRRAIAGVGQHLEHKIGGNALVVLLQLAPALEREARPQRDHTAAAIGDDAVELTGAAHQAYRRQVGFPELQRA